MKLTNIRLRDFRNYQDINLNFSKSNINVLYGDNAQGKTNLVESIHYASLLNSFRTNNDQSLINKDKMFSIMEYDFEKNNKKVKIKIVLSKSGKKIYVDNVEFKKFRDYIGQVNVISFCSDDIRKFKEAPKERRKFFDEEISKFDKKYLLHLLKIKKYLKQRNEILKNETKYLNEYLDVIDQKISEDSLYICEIRKKFIDEINKNLSNIYFKLTNQKVELKVKYSSLLKKEDLTLENIKKIYKDNREKDIEKKQTNVGIQKENFECLIDNQIYSEYASQGQQRLILLAIKLSVLKIIEEENKIKALLILDDIFSELDNEKKKQILEYIKNENQIFITTTNKKEIQLKNLDIDISYFNVNKGVITERMD
ncbi:MAG: DNA replication and repair protein RecF [Erysipelotrichaceae bacterium]|nr:DNA replication and repair protein RecF [Erysipelotrichaceae bacterium]